MRKITSLFSLVTCLSMTLSPVSATPNSADLKKLDTLVKKTETVSALDLANTDLREKNFDSAEETNLKGSNFRGSNFSGTSQKKKVIRNIDFSNCDLTGANFSYTDISSCTFKGAQLSSANFTGAKITFTRFREADLKNAIFDNTDQESVGYDQSDLRCSSWKNGKLYRISFSRADERGMITDGLKETDCSHENVTKTGWFQSYSCPCGS